MAVRPLGSSAEGHNRDQRQKKHRHKSASALPPARQPGHLLPLKVSHVSCMLCRRAGVGRSQAGSLLSSGLTGNVSLVCALACCTGDALLGVGPFYISGDRSRSTAAYPASPQYYAGRSEMWLGVPRHLTA